MSSPTDEASFVDNTALLAQVLSLTARVAELESELKIAKGGAAMSFNPITLTIVSECAECMKREAQAEADAVALVVTTAAAEAEAEAAAEAAEAARCAEEAESVALQSKKHIDPPRRVSTRMAFWFWFSWNFYVFWNATILFCTKYIWENWTIS